VTDGAWSHCPACGFTTKRSGASGDRCPNCGSAMEAPASAPGLVWEGGADPIRNYFRTVWAILTRPAAFFRGMPMRGGLGGPLAFALVTHWLGSAAAFLWQSLLGHGLVERLQQAMRGVRFEGDGVDSFGRHDLWMRAGDRLIGWFWGAGAIITDPFFTLISILFTSAFVYAGARLLVRGERVSFESAARVVAYGLTPAIVGVIPFFGGLAASIYVAVVTIIGAREVYRIGTARAAVVALFPKLLFLGFFLLALLALLAVAVKLLGGLLGA
jgi:hypothetical protein